MTASYEHERMVAELAVQRASLLTKRVLAGIDKGALDKSDDTPVTIADFGAQALLIAAIHHNFPDDTFVGEESAAALREDEKLKSRIWDLVSTTQLKEKDEELKLGSIGSAKEMMDIIDLGQGAGGAKGRVWVLDPVDGTATFMRGQQYAVCLALVEQGEQRLGVIGCPNLDLSTGKVAEQRADNSGYGQMLSAVRGEGAVIRPLGDGSLWPSRPVARREGIPSDTASIHFVDCTDSKSLDLVTHRKVAEKLGAPWPGTNLWSSQMRYIAMAVGGGDVMLRTYSKPCHVSYIWDHAGGCLIYEEAGGKVTDVNGNAIDFGAGRELRDNPQMVSAPVKAHATILKAVYEARKV